MVPESSRLNLSLWDMSFLGGYINITSAPKGDICLRGAAQIPMDFIGVNDTFDFEISVTLMYMGRAMPFSSAPFMHFFLQKVPEEYTWIKDILTPHLDATYCKVNDICGFLKTLFANEKYESLIDNLRADERLTDEQKTTAINALEKQASYSNVCSLNEWAEKLIEVHNCTFIELPATNMDSLTNLLSSEGLKMQVYPQLTKRNKQTGDEFQVVCAVLPFTIGF
jgi:hypothetical protein